MVQAGRRRWGVRCRRIHRARAFLRRILAEYCARRRSLRRRRRAGHWRAGRCARRDVPPYLGGAAATVISSTEPETFCHTAAEALSAGTPVVTFELGNVPRMAGPAGCAVPLEAGAAGLWAALDGLLDDPDAYHAASRAAPARVAASTWSRRHVSCLRRPTSPDPLQTSISDYTRLQGVLCRVGAPHGPVSVLSWPRRFGLYPGADRAGGSAEPSPEAPQDPAGGL
ncbi:MAG: glycosyltransferase [Pseudonocardiaceae bacterium]